MRASKTAPEFREKFDVKYQNNSMFLDGIFGQNKHEKKNDHFLTLKIYKNAAFSDAIYQDFTHILNKIYE